MDTMSILSIAVLAFIAGFLTCAAAVAAVVFWSFSDRRVRPLGPKQAKQRVA